ncbi:DUF1302 domain-containing protein [Zavarzinia aquatilis]|uniref:DUF1302 domain-containing protein n=1 Tax=Zavarzinia aquatilis TaxID=2211142 RepID=A0A317DYI5_9PROT|nr:DUF1302 domain-containing protein [Zavarzinia aquatilis]
MPRHDKNISLATAVSAIALAVVVGTSFSAQAAPIDTGNPDIAIYFDNTLKYSLGWRVENPSAEVANNSIGVQANTDDGDLNFDKGLISNRVDLLSEFGLTYKRDFGFRISAAAWYDDVYMGKNDNPGAFGGALVNTTSAPYNRFSDEAQDLHGQNAELLDAFVFGKIAIGDTGLNLRAGRFTQLYGESLFFGSNGIAAAQTSLDLVKALSVPNSRFQEILRPIGQVTGQIQLSSELSLGAYYQFEWRKTRLPAAGSYFSFADFVDDGGETLILGPGAIAHRGSDIDARDQGQGGAQIRWTPGDVEYGFYVANFHDKIPQFYVRPGVNVEPGTIGDYLQVFGEDIFTVGASASTLIGDTNVAGEISFRDNMPLVASGNAVIIPGNTTADGGDNAAFPVGRTLHANVSAISVFNESALWQGASIIGEFAYNNRLSIDKNADQLDPLATKDAGALQFIFTPEYFQVLPGVDLQVPIGVSYGLFGRSSVSGVLFPSEGGGVISLGVKADYQKTWQASLSFAHYYGSEGSIVLYDTAVPELSYKNFHGDRDFIALSIQRTF